MVYGTLILKQYMNMKWLCIICFIFVYVLPFTIQDNDISEYLTCEKPLENRTLYNCVSDYFFFPAISATCVNCGKQVQVKCNSSQQWEPVKPLVNNCIRNVTSERQKKLKCMKRDFKNLTCPYLEDTNNIGYRATCYCKFTCIEISMECKPKNMNSLSYWKKNYGQNGRNCSSDGIIIKEGPLIINFKNPTYYFSCISGYELDKNSNTSLTCSNGIINGLKPTCIKQTGYYVIILIIVFVPVLIGIGIIIIIYLYLKPKLNIHCNENTENKTTPPIQELPFCISETIPITYVNDIRSQLIGSENVISVGSICDPTYLGVLPPYKYDYVECKELRKQIVKRKKRECSQCKAENDITANETAGYLTPEPLKYDYIDCKDFRKDFGESSKAPDLHPKVKVTTRGQERSQDGAQCYENVMGVRAQQEIIEDSVNHYEVIELPLPSKKNKRNK